MISNVSDLLNVIVYMTAFMLLVDNIQVMYQCKLDIRKYSFSQRTINEWNKLSTDCITAT